MAHLRWVYLQAFVQQGHTVIHVGYAAKDIHTMWSKSKKTKEQNEHRIYLAYTLTYFTMQGAIGFIPWKGR